MRGLWLKKPTETGQPDGERYEAYRAGWGQRWLDRFGVKFGPRARRRLRNARKQERKLLSGERPAAL